MNLPSFSSVPWSSLSIPALDSIAIISLVIVVIAFVISITGINNDHSVKVLRFRNAIIAINFVALVALLGFILNPQLRTSSEQLVELVTKRYIDEAQAVKSPTISEDSNRYTLVSPFESNQSTQQYVNQFFYSEKIAKHYYLPSVEHLLYREPNARYIRIFGDGLSAEETKYFRQQTILYNPPEKINGLIEPLWNPTISIGSQLYFSAKLHSKVPGIHKAELFDPAGLLVMEKSVLNGELFYLNNLPKIPGKHSYQLVIKTPDNRQLIKEAINIQVVRPDNTKILVVQSSPSFETKQLQNWANRNGSSFLMLTKISKDKYISRSSNFSQEIASDIKTNPFKLDFLSQFDLLIIDGRSILQTPEDSLSHIISSSANGLGVLIRADSAYLKAMNEQRSYKEVDDNKNGKLFDFVVTPVDKKIWTTARLSSDSYRTDIKLKHDISVIGNAISPSNTKPILNSIVRSAQGNMIIASTQNRLGIIALSLVSDTHHLVTSGHSESYGKFWNSIIRSIGRKPSNASLNIRSKELLNFAGERTEICGFIPELRNQSEVTAKVTYLAWNKISGDAEKTSRINETTSSILLSNRSSYNSHQFCGVFWPPNQGWYNVSISKAHLLSNEPADGDVEEQNHEHADSHDTHLNFFVESKESWKLAQQLKKIEATLDYVNRSSKNDVSSPILLPINRWIFWWSFIISAAILWLLRRI